MLTACWSVKGGSGTTVVAAALTMALAGYRASPSSPLTSPVIWPPALGVAEPQGAGVRDWLEAGENVPADGLARIAVGVERGITLVPTGEWTPGHPEPGAAAMQRLASELRGLHSGGPVVADCGVAAGRSMHAFIDSADRSLLVLRPCYLALRRAVAAPRPTAFVLINEPGRSLSVRDIEHALGVPAAAMIDFDPGVAHAIDTGLLRRRLPRRITNALRGVAA